MTTATEQLQELEARIRALEREADERARLPGLLDLVERLVPADVRGHLRAARCEDLLALRAYLDRMIERTEAHPSSQEHRRVDIE